MRIMKLFLKRQKFVGRVFIWYFKWISWWKLFKHNNKSITLTKEVEELAKNLLDKYLVKWR